MTLVQEACYYAQLARAKDCAHVYLGNCRAVTRTRDAGGQGVLPVPNTEWLLRTHLGEGPEWEVVPASQPSLEIWLAAASGLWTSFLPWDRSISRLRTIVCPIPGLQMFFHLGAVGYIWGTSCVVQPSGLATLRSR